MQGMLAKGVRETLEMRYARYCYWRYRLLQLVGKKNFEFFRNLELS